MAHHPDKGPNFDHTVPVTIEELDTFFTTRESYKNTDNPQRTLQVALMDEVQEISIATQADELTEEIGDALAMGTLVARNQGIPLAAIIDQPTLSEFQNSAEITHHDDWTPWMELSVAAMRVYENLFYHDREQGNPTMSEALQYYFATLANLATESNIRLDDASRHMMAKLEARTRPNHAVADIGKADKPQTHTGRLLAAAGIMSPADIIAAERESL